MRNGTVAFAEIMIFAFHFQVIFPHPEGVLVTFIKNIVEGQILFQFE